MQNKYRE